MDIRQFDVVGNAEKGFKLYFENPYKQGEQLPFFMTVLGADSKIYKKAKRAQQLEILNDTMDNSEKRTAAYLDKLENDNEDILAQLVTSLGETEKGKDTDYILDGDRKCFCNKKDIKHLLSTFPWMRDQVSIAVNKRLNFLVVG